MEFLDGADFWIGLVKIVWINIILSGDNAVVIALSSALAAPRSKSKPSCLARALRWCCALC